MKHLKLLLISLTLLAVAGCVDLPKKSALNRTNYMLNVPAPKNSQQKINTIVMINNATIAPQYASSYFIYQTGNSTYNTDYYHKFFISPSLMITQIMESWLSPHFTQVIPNTSMIVPNYIIQPDITSLYANLQTKQAVMAIKIMLLSRASISVNLHFQKIFTASNPFTLNNPQSLVNAWNQDLQQILTQMVGTLTAQMK